MNKGPARGRPKGTGKPKTKRVKRNRIIPDLELTVLEVATQHLKQVYDLVKHWENTRDKDLQFLPQRVYNTWFDFDFRRRKRKEQPSLVHIDPSRKD